MFDRDPALELDRIARLDRRRRAVAVVLYGVLLLVAVAVGLILMRFFGRGRLCEEYPGRVADYCHFRRALVTAADDPALAALICGGISAVDIRLDCNTAVGGETPAAERADCDAIDDPALRSDCRIARARAAAPSDAGGALAACNAAGGTDLWCVEEIAGAKATESLGSTELLCFRQDDALVRAACYRGLARHVGTTDPAAAQTVCNLLERTDDRHACLTGLGAALAATRGLPDARDWCDRFDPDDAGACRDGALTVAKSVAREAGP